ncbi:MAG: Gfo/Idh/MocA family oxidoreductase [Flavobacteriales bacterium]|nr:Gfo/Idh/MocA family oxidoreductase [Flavobacteriales bacterium]
MKKIKFAVIGLGHIGLRHSKIAHEHPDSETIACCDVLPEREQKLRELGLNAKFYIDYKELITQEHDVDVVNIAAPNGLHTEIALFALEHGKHVVIEKPMALSRADCEKIIFKSLQKSRNVFVVKQNRYSPPSKWLKEVVDQKIIGDVLMVQVNCYWNRDNRYYKPENWKGSLAMDGGTLFTQFSHFIDIMYWIFGDITKIQAIFKNATHKDLTEFEDSGFVNFEFVNGGLGCLNFSTSCWDTNMESSITVVGSKGSAKLGGQYLNEVEYSHIENYTVPELPPTNPPNDYGPFKGSAANHHYVIQNVVDTLNGKSQIDTNALEGLKVVDIIERIYQLRDLNNL